MKGILSSFLVVALSMSCCITNVRANDSPTEHTITDTGQIIGSSASVWNEFKNGDVLDISQLSTTELGGIYIPEDISALTIRGSTDKTYTKFNLNSENAVSITLENVKASSSTGPSSFYLPENAQSTIIAIGTNEFTSANNSKCIIGNVTFKGDGDLSIKSGQSTSNSNLAHGIYGNVVFDHTGTITVTSGNGKYGGSTSNGISAGDAILGNVECRNTGTIEIKGGGGGSGSYTSGGSSVYTGNGGNGINGNLICNGNNTITITGGYSAESANTAGSGVLGNVIVKKQTKLTITGGSKNKTTNTDGCGIYGYLKAYDDSVVVVTGGKGDYGSSSGCKGGVGIYGDVHLYNNANVTSIGGAGGSGGYNYNGGSGNSGIVGSVYLHDNSLLTTTGGAGCNVTRNYSSDTMLSTTSIGGSGGSGIEGDVAIDENCSLIAKGGKGGDGGYTTTSKGGNAGSGIIGAITTNPNIKLVALPGTPGDKYYSATSGTTGSKGYGVISSSKPILDGGYVNALFYNESKKSMIPVDSNGNDLYLVKITPIVQKEPLINKDVSITSEDLTYWSFTDEDGNLYCYLPTNVSLNINYDEYSASLSKIWEDNNTNMYLTLKTDNTESPDVINGTTHAITEASELIGRDANIWTKVNNGDIIDISGLTATELGSIYIPADISLLKFKGSSDKTYSKLSINCEESITLTLEDIKATSSSFRLSETSQSKFIVEGTNEFTASDNSKCIIGNVVFTGSGDLTIKSGKSYWTTNLPCGISGNVIFDHTGTIKVISGDGRSGTSSSVDGMHAGDAICGNVECRNTGTIIIEGGDGGSVYTNSSASGGRGGNGGSGISGNLLCNGSNTITITGGTGGYLGLRGTSSTPGTSGSGVLGNVIVKNSTNLSISGGNKRSYDDTNGYGIKGYLKAYDNSVVTVTGGAGALRGSSIGGDGGIGVYGNVTLYGNSTVICNGGKGSNGDSGNSSYPSSFGSGGDGNVAIIGDVALHDTCSLTANGGKGGNGGNMYYSSSTTYGTSDGGDGAAAITGNVFIEDGCELIVNCADGGDGGRAKTSNGGNAGSGIIGELTMGSDVVIKVISGDVGTKYSSSSTGSNGIKGYDIIIDEIPVINGGYINALFYNSSKKSVTPIDSIGNNLYLTKIVPYVDNELIPNSSVRIVSEECTYLSTTDENGEIYCYLPSSADMKLVYGNYSAPLSQVWEDNNTSMYLTLEYQGNNIAGNVKSFGNSTAETSIELLSGDTVIETLKISGNNGNYAFNGIVAGTYTLRISKSMHCSRDYRITLDGSDISQNVEIWLYGDVNGDGTVNHVDVLQINRNIASQSSVFDTGTDELNAYRFKVGNVTAINGSDTVLNHVDVLQINRKIANLTSIFDSLS